MFGAFSEKMVHNITSFTYWQASSRNNTLAKNSKSKAFGKNLFCAWFIKSNFELRKLFFGFMTLRMLKHYNLIVKEQEICIFSM